METRKRHPISRPENYLTNSELTNIILSATAVITLLEAAKPSRTKKDYTINIACISGILFGLACVGVGLMKFLNDQEEQEKQNLLNTLLPIKQQFIAQWVEKRWISPGSKGFDNIELGCLETEQQFLDCHPNVYASLKYSACKHIQQTFCTKIAPIEERLDQIIVPDTTSLTWLLAGTFIVLSAFYQLMRAEQNRLELSNINLTELQKHRIKSAGSDLKLNISDQANINDIIKTFNERINLLKGIKPPTTSQRFFNFFTHRKNNYDIPFEMESNITKLKPKQIG